MFKQFPGAMFAGLFMATAVLLSACAGGVPADAQQLTRGHQEINLSNYRAVMVDPVSVEFDRRWKPVLTGSHLEMSQGEKDRVKRDIQALFDESFSEELTAKGNLRIVDRPGAGVLRITPELVDVYLNAPAPMMHPGSTFTRSVGHVTLHLTFNDASTGEQVLELHDRVRGRDIGQLRPASPVYNRSELSRIFEEWAQVVREDLFLQP